MKLFKSALSLILAAMIIASLCVTAAAEENSLPAAYSSAEKGYVTPVKDQKDTNVCWAYAAMAACESSMIIHNGYDTSLDLSELLTAYAGYNFNADKLGMFDGTQFNSTYIDEGNRSEYTKFALANLQGVVTESANHGQFSSQKLFLDFPNTFKVYNPETMYSYNEAYVTDVYEIPYTNLDLVKEYIMTFGACTAEHSNVPDYYNEETGAYFCYGEHWPNHVVTVVGWDDNYSRENFRTDGPIPENDGAWLIKNSFGTEHGNDGYNWISYEDVSILRYPAVFYKLAKSEPYTYAYQYDDLSGHNMYWDEENGILFKNGAYTANVFTSQKDNEILEAVSFYTVNEDVDYTVEIYTGLKDSANPASGTLRATLKGEKTVKGYHTLKLNEALSLTKGEKFSVVINLKNEQGINIFTDGFRSPRDNKIFESGESFVSLDGKSWTDLYGVADGNLRIKAFAKSTEDEAELTDYYSSFEGKTREYIIQELEYTLKQCDAVVGTPQYEEDFLYGYLFSMYSYASCACENTDIFLASELAGLNKSIKYYYSEVTGEPEIVYPPATPDEPVADLLGDTNGDGKVNVKDATLIQKSAAKILSLTEGEALRADVNKDNKINVKDATAIQKFVAKIVTGLPIGQEIK